MWRNLALGEGKLLCSGKILGKINQIYVACNALQSLCIQTGFNIYFLVMYVVDIILVIRM